MKWVCDISASFFVHRLEISLQPSCVLSVGYLCNLRLTPVSRKFRPYVFSDSRA